MTQQEINRKTRDALASLRKAKASFFQATIADDSPLTVNLHGSVVPALGTAGTGPYSAGDRVTVAVWGSNILIIGRASPTPTAPPQPRP